MKVALVQSPIEDFYTTGSRSYPLGLLQIAANIQDICRVRIFDCRNDDKTKQLSEHPFPELVSVFNNAYKSPFSLFSQYHRFGWDKQRIQDEICTYNPDIVGISCLMSTYYNNCLDTLKWIKEVNDRIITVVGGLHPTLYPTDVLSETCVDYVIRGDGETAMRRLIDFISGKVKGAIEPKGICTKSDGRLSVSEINIEENIDTIPAHNLLISEQYHLFKKPYAFLQSSRGCPLKCRFCGKFPGPFRIRSIESIRQELDLLNERNVKILDIEDDMLTWNTGFFEELLELLSIYPFECYAMNGLYYNNLRPELLEKLQKAGFRKINLSVVTISNTSLIRQSRKIDRVLPALLSAIEELDLRCEVHFIIGLPDQSISEVLETIIHLMQYNVLLGPSIYYPVPGSSYWNEHPVEFKYCRSSAMYPISFNHQTTLTLMRLVRFINYCKDLIDRNDISCSVEEMLETKHMFKSERDFFIFKNLVKEGVFIAFDKEKKDYIIEQQQPEIIQDFFVKATSLNIKGYKTLNTLRLVGPSP